MSVTLQSGSHGELTKIPAPSDSNDFSRSSIFHRTTGCTGSPAAFQKAKVWLQNCIANHKYCGSDNVQRLPSRLLDLGLDDADILKLVEKVGEHGKYAALSHCWGATPQFTTTKATLLERKEKIFVAQMTRTFREAVQITRALNIQYLWVRPPFLIYLPR